MPCEVGMAEPVSLVADATRARNAIVRVLQARRFGVAFGCVGCGGPPTVPKCVRGRCEIVTTGGLEKVLLKGRGRSSR